ncbi:MAG: hypothetical protein MRY83_06865 [Flavobacteriales bacterium]|nr:hypothetical protein [Flavobacteriales bacterium]
MASLSNNSRHNNRKNENNKKLNHVKSWHGFGLYENNNLGEMKKEKIISGPSSTDELMHQADRIVEKHKELGVNSPLNQVYVSSIEQQLNLAKEVQNSCDDQFKMILGWSNHRSSNSLLKLILMVKKVLVQKLKDITMIEEFGFKFQTV